MSAMCPVCHERVFLGERFCASCGTTIGLLGSSPGFPAMIAASGEGTDGIRPLPPSPPMPIDPPVQPPDRRRPLGIGAVVLLVALLGGLAALALDLGGGDDPPSLPTPPTVSTEDAAGAPGAAIGTRAVGASPEATPVASGVTPVATPVPAATPVFSSPIGEIMPAPSADAQPAGLSGLDDAAGSSTSLTLAGGEAGDATDVQPRLVRALQRATLAYLRSGAAGPPPSAFEALSERRSMLESASALTGVIGDVARMLAMESIDPPVPPALPEPPSPTFLPSDGALPEPTPGPERPPRSADRQVSNGYTVPDRWAVTGELGEGTF